MNTSDPRVQAAANRAGWDVGPPTFALTIDLPFPESPGVLIGRQGRNVRAFETATGCDLLLDELPGLAVVSAFDPSRRQVGRLTLLNSLVEGSIHPWRLSELSSEVKRRIGDVARLLAEEACRQARSELLPESILDELGKLAWLRSGPTTELRLSSETSLLARAIAVETGADPETHSLAGLVSRLGLLRASARPLAEESAATAEALGFARDVVEAIGGEIVGVAHTLVEQRLGARRPALEAAWREAQALEERAFQTPGVAAAAVLRGGRRLVVWLDPEASEPSPRALDPSGRIEVIAIRVPQA